MIFLHCHHNQIDRVPVSLLSEQVPLLDNVQWELILARRLVPSVTLKREVFQWCITVERSLSLECLLSFFLVPVMFIFPFFFNLGVLAGSRVSASRVIRRTRGIVISSLEKLADARWPGNSCSTLWCSRQ